jgi:hypothetical protein
VTRAPGVRAGALDDELAEDIAAADGWELAGAAAGGPRGPRPSSGLLA